MTVKEPKDPAGLDQPEIDLRVGILHLGLHLEIADQSSIAQPTML